MARTVKQKKTPAKVKKTKMTPYCMTGDEPIAPSQLKSGASYEDYQYPNEAKKARKDYQIERRAEKKSTRQKAKAKIKNEIKKL